MLPFLLLIGRKEVKMYQLNKKEAIKTIESTIKNNEWEKRLKYIKEMKYKILNEIQMFPTIENIFKLKGLL